jgi:hypothetical protein
VKRKPNIRVGKYRSIRAAYTDLKPNMTYLAFYKRIKGGMPLDEAVAQPTSPAGRKRAKPLPWEGS